MSELAWRRATHPEEMLALLGPSASPRKLRLFACACCRAHPDQVLGAPAWEALAAAERFADGAISAARLRQAAAASTSPLVTTATLASARDAALRVSRLARDRAEADRQALRKLQAEVEAVAVADNAVEATGAARHGAAAARAVRRAVLRRERQEAARQTKLDANLALRDDLEAHGTLLRELFGNPFRRAPFDERWRWANAREVLALARALYEERRLDELPVLADALVDAGCADGPVLEHLRRPGGGHVLGCWALDRVLGKEGPA
jgi:hypothetical protein